MTEVKETEEVGCQTTKATTRKEQLKRTNSQLAEENKMSPDKKINLAVEEEYSKTMDFFDNYVNFSDKMQKTMDDRKRIDVGNEDFYNMVNQELTPMDLT